MVITILALIVIVLILLIIVYILFNTYIKTRENYSNTNAGALSPSSYNSTNCKPKTNEVQYPAPYNDSCNLENSLDTFLTTSKYIKNKQLEPALSLHTLPKLHSSKKLLAYNEYCDISQSSITNKIPDAYNDYCISQIRLVPPPEIYSNVYKPPPEPIIPRTSITIPTASPRVTPPANNNSNVTQVHIITTRPLGYGNINGWYSRTTSTHLLDNPLTIYYEQMLRNYAPDTWKSLLRFPTVAQLPDYGSWWNWASELENINKVIDYLGTTLGKFETHFVAATEKADPLTWVKKQQRSEEASYNIINTTLENMLLNKINTARPNANIVLTQDEWSSCNIIANIITLHYINVGSSQYRPFSQGTDDVNRETLAIIGRDWEIGHWGDINPNLTLRVEECTGICLSYKTKANKNRMYMACDIGIGHYRAMKQEWFVNLSNNDKTQWLREQIYAYISHEYTHVYQMQLIDSVIPARWHRDRTQLGERTPNSLTGWWVECFATLLPYFMGFSFHNFDMLSKITDAINNIKTSNSLTATEFSDRMMYRHPYGYFPDPTNQYYMWAYLVATHMAKLKTWKYVLVDFYYDFQRVPSTISLNISGRTMLAPDLDKLFLHNFNKTEEAFLQDIYAKVKNSKITLQSLRDMLPGGANFGIPELIKFNQSNLINPIGPSTVPRTDSSIVPSIVPSTVPSIVPSTTTSIVPRTATSIVPPTATSRVPSIIPSTTTSIVPSTNSITIIDDTEIFDTNSNITVPNNIAYRLPIDVEEG